MQEYRVNICITTEGNGKKGETGPEEDRNPREQTPNLTAPGLAPGAHGDITCAPTAWVSASSDLLPVAPTALILGQLHSMLKAFLGGCPIVLASVRSWGLQCNLDLTTIVIFNGLLKLPSRESDPAIFPDLVSSWNLVQASGTP